MKADYECNYAYLKKETGEISTVNISLKVAEKKLKVIIETSDDYYPIYELEDILQQLQKNYLLRARIDIFDECEVYLSNKTILKKVYFKGRTFEIDKIEELERI